MKIIATTLAVVLIAGSLPAAASDIDLSIWTCREFKTASKDDVTVILAWLDGYYKQEDDPPVINTDQFVASAKKLGEYCAAHPDIGLITATDKLFQRE